MISKKYYTVWIGNKTGVFDNWDDCKDAVTGCAAKYKSFPTREEAEKAFTEDYNLHIKSKKDTAFNYQNMTSTNRPVVPSLAVDAACSGNPGKVEFRGVEVYSGAEVFKRGPYEEGTQNIGEFLAIAFGLAMLKKGNYNMPIYSDSLTAIGWIKNKKCNTKLPRTEKNKELFAILDKAEEWLRNNEWPNTIIKWNTDEWGEIPADFGRK